MVNNPASAQGEEAQPMPPPQVSPLAPKQGVADARMGLAFTYHP